MATVGFVHAITHGYKSNGLVINTTEESFIGDGQADEDVLVPASATNFTITVSITKANIVALCLFGASTLTLKTNSNSTPQDTITLQGGTQTVWSTSSVAACPFSGDITSFHLANTAAVPVRFRLAVLLNN